MIDWVDRRFAALLHRRRIPTRCYVDVARGDSALAADVAVAVRDQDEGTLLVAIGEYCIPDNPTTLLLIELCPNRRCSCC
jgi:hypothetical protein